MHVCPSSGKPDKPAVPLVSSKNRSERDETRQCNIVNANYQKVMSVLESFMRDDRYRICRCRRCLGDTAALALNYLPPHYFVDASRGGDVGSPSVMVESAVHEAMETVRKNPRHEKYES
jgi:competence protein ComFB